MKPTLSMLARRLADSILVILVIVFVTFAFVRLLGDPVSEAMYAGGATQAEVEAVLHKLGYDRPLLVQFQEYLWNALHGDFGLSSQFGSSALEIVMSRVPATLYLAAVSLLITLALFVPLGFIAGRRPFGWFDQALSAVTGFALSVPVFVFGAFLILLFAVQWRLLPVSGNQSPLGVLLPAVTLALHAAARLARVLRASMVETQTMDYVLLGRAKGLSKFDVDLKYVFRNSLLPVIVILGLQIANLLGGAVIVEVIFGWPGIGLLTQQALLTSDFNLIQCIVVLVAITVLVVNFLTDILSTFIDPRIKLAGK